MVAGFHLSLDAPSATAAALAVAQAVLPKVSWLKQRDVDLAWPVHGLPEVIHVDNGREFHSRAFERGCQQHGIQIEYRPPATPRFGGHIERLMGTLMGRVHAFPGSTSSNSAARGSYDSEARAVLSFQEFERILAALCSCCHLCRVRDEVSPAYPPGHWCFRRRLNGRVACRGRAAEQAVGTRGADEPPGAAVGPASWQPDPPGCDHAALRSRYAFPRHRPRPAARAGFVVPSW